MAALLDGTVAVVDKLVAAPSVAATDEPRVRRVCAWRLAADESWTALKPHP